MFDRDRLLQLVRSRWPFLVAGLVLLVYAGLGAVYLQATGARQSKTESLARQSAIVRGAVGRVEEAEAAYRAVQESIPPSTLVEIDVFRQMRALASQGGFAEQGVTIELKSDTGSVQIGKERYRSLAFSMSVRGDSQIVRAFVEKLDQGQTPFKTLVLEEASLQLGERDGEATMTFTIYTQPTTP